MAENSKIEWCDHTFSPWIGCQHVSPGCDNCFAETMMDTRYGKVEWGPHGERKRTSVDYWRQPLRWARKVSTDRARAFNHDYPLPHRPRVFCASLCDVFDNQVPKEWRFDLWELIRSTPELDWLLLTKRPENIGRFLPYEWALQDRPLPNVWLGFTAEDQEHFDRRWPIVRDIPAAVRFCSYEPALGPLQIPDDPRLSQIICGGETGSGYRIMNVDWARVLRDQCAVYETKFFMKQMSGKKPIPDDLMIREFPRAAA
jgi:protein gp37